MEWETVEKMQGCRLNVGCGEDVATYSRYGGWIGVDARLDEQGSPWAVCHTFPDPIPVSDGAVSGVLTDHFLEHLREEDAVQVIRELYRILVPGGVMRVAVPDAYHPSHEADREAGDDSDPAHLSLWSVSDMVTELALAGFSQIEPVAFWQGSQSSGYQFTNRYDEADTIRGAVNRIPKGETEGTHSGGTDTVVEGTSLIVDAVK